jgi:hypothetical protein
MELSEFANHFRGWTRRGNKIFCLCPAHADKNPSLQVSRQDSGKILLHCFAGCETQDVLDVTGLTWADLEPDGQMDRYYTKIGSDEIPLIELLDDDDAKNAKTNGKPRVVANYDYYDEHGTLIFRVVRSEPKSFRQCRPHPTKPDKWIWQTRSVKRVLFRLPELISASLDEWIILTEGEKNVHAAVELGFGRGWTVERRLQFRVQRSTRRNRRRQRQAGPQAR